MNKYCDRLGNPVHPSDIRKCTDASCGPNCDICVTGSPGYNTVYVAPWQRNVPPLTWTEFCKQQMGMAATTSSNPMWCTCLNPDVPESDIVPVMAGGLKFCAERLTGHYIYKAPYSPGKYWLRWDDFIAQTAGVPSPIKLTFNPNATLPPITVVGPYTVTYPKSFTDGEWDLTPNPPRSSICPCGINRADCEYHDPSRNS